MSGAQPDRGAIDAILAERARLLARPIVQPETEPSVDVLEFVCGEQRYALDTALIHRVEPLAHVTPLPGAPRYFTGIANVHGQLVPLVDIGRLQGAPPCTKAAFVIVIGTTHPDIGIVADGVRDIRAVPRDAFSRRVTADGTAVIDGQGILADSRLVAGMHAGSSSEENVP